ncbi:MAG: Lrp/AsnC family transcriptional regulator [bacterium]
MDKLDKRILKRLQGEFPLDTQPFKVIGDELGIDEDSVINSVLSLKNRGIIKEIGPIFNHKSFGYETTLVGMKVDPHRIEEIANIINEYQEITHNYERDGEFNLWFTLIERKEKMEELIEGIRKKVKPVSFVSLPSISSFKLTFELEI